MESVEPRKSEISFTATVCEGNESAARASVSLVMGLSDDLLRISSLDGLTNFSARIRNRHRFRLQLERAYLELFKANRAADYPSWTELYFEELGDSASVTIEQFCDAADLFELTLTIRSEESNQGLWLSVQEAELKKMVTAL